MLADLTALKNWPRQGRKTAREEVVYWDKGRENGNFYARVLQGLEFGDAVRQSCSCGALSGRAEHCVVEGPELVTERRRYACQFKVPADGWQQQFRVPRCQRRLRWGRFRWLDSQTASDLKGLAIACPWLIVELAEVMHGCMLVQGEAAIVSCQDRFFSWRVVRIPKYCEAAVRPIAIARAVVGSWNRALLAQFPPPPEGQYWLSWPQRCVCNSCMVACPGVRGAELDLRKAFDSVQHDVARGRFWTVCGAWFGVLPVIAFFMERPHRKLCALHVACLLVIPAALPYCPLCWGPGPNWLRPSPGLRTSSTWMIGVWLIMPLCLLSMPL